jgi:hypothetical protein
VSRHNPESFTFWVVLGKLITVKVRMTSRQAHGTYPTTMLQKCNNVGFYLGLPFQFLILSFLKSLYKNCQLKNMIIEAAVDKGNNI